RLGQSAALGGRVGKAAPRRGAPDTDGPEPGMAETDDLPRRVRQAGISPELRDNVPAQGDAAGTGARSPEAARATMTSLSSGRRRARAARDENDGGPR
ncbi:hypothetical protein, partial [Streptomyces sp. NPDC002790]|uniref:hypothetical protein n=1 Tax=Streptomyces sp. NPDC002790 TaxID=3154431 RepID=UPI0033271829